MPDTRCAFVVATMGLAAGVAHAEGAGEGAIDVWSNYQWSPGDPHMQPDARVTWDWNVHSGTTDPRAGTRRRSTA